MKTISSLDVTSKSCLVVLALILLLPLIFCWYLAFGNEPIYRPLQQRTLARRLGIETEGYFPHPNFPFSYYHDRLEKEMTIVEVHQLIQGYTKVLRCGVINDSAREIYYYYSNSDYSALRFQVEYYKGKFVWLQGEDEDWRTIRTENCEEGRFPVEPDGVR